MGTLTNLCSPALIYLVFSLTQISIDIFKGENNRAFFKSIVMIIFTTMLNVLCNRGLGIISWMLVFIPFMLMSFVTTILLIVFGLDPSSGRLKYNPSHRHHNVKPVDYRRKREGRHRKHPAKKYDDEFAPVPPSANKYSDTGNPELPKSEKISPKSPPPPTTTTTEQFQLNYLNNYLK